MGIDRQRIGAQLCLADWVAAFGRATPLLIYNKFGMQGACCIDAF